MPYFETTYEVWKQNLKLKDVIHSLVHYYYYGTYQWWAQIICFQIKSQKVNKQCFFSWFFSSFFISQYNLFLYYVGTRSALEAERHLKT